ncbi:MAG: amidoligase family protein [Alphaproteobacteria bacterium]|nr:amidoligase family protein [Alphaproteobacteria bacterium]
MGLEWKTGFEIELLAPRGLTRFDLASRVARRRGGSVRRFFHPQQEPGGADGQAIFENLTPGFEALDSEGRPLARFVDDVTLQADFDRKAAALSGWYRILTDDGRLLRLIARTCDPDAPLDRVLAPIAALFGTTAEMHASGMVKVSDERDVSVAIAAPLPGERERACEIVTPPLDRDQEAVLGFLLGEAAAAGFTCPREGATHVHFDATPLLSARTIANLVAVLSRHGDALKRLVGTNPHCIRLGKWPDRLLALAATEGFAALDWPAARKELSTVGLTKHCDFNLLNLVSANKAKHTFEVRILPSSLDPTAIVEAAELFAAIRRTERAGGCCSVALVDPASNEGAYTLAAVCRRNV